MDFKNKINKNQVRIFELIQSEKKNENKKRWIFEGIHIWPIVCGFLHNSIYSSTIYSKRITKTTRFSSIKRLLLNFSTYICYIFINRKNYFFFLKKNIDAIFVSDGVSQQLIDKHYYEVFFQSLIRNYKNPIVFDLGLKNSFPNINRVKNLFVKTFLIEKKVRFFTKKKEINLVGYENFLNNLKKSTDTNFYKRFETKRLIIDLLEIIEWKNYWIKIMKKTCAKNIFMIAYYNTMNWGLILACKELKKKCIDIQHGVISDNVIPYSNFLYKNNYVNTLPSDFFVWSKYEKTILQKNFGKLSKYSVIDHPWKVFLEKNKFNCLKEIENNVKTISLKKEINILIAHQPVREWQNCFKPIIQIINEKKDWNFWFRLHPTNRDKLSNEIKALKKKENVYFEIATNTPINILFKYVDLVITPESSISIEASLFSLKTIFLIEHSKTTKMHLIKQGKAVFLNNKSDIVTKIYEWKKK